MTEPKITLITRRRPNLENSIEKEHLSLVEQRMFDCGYEPIFVNPLILHLDLGDQLWAYGEERRDDEKTIRTVIEDFQIVPAAANGRRYAIAIKAIRATLKNGAMINEHHGYYIARLNADEAAAIPHDQIITIHNDLMRIWVKPGTDTEKEHPWPEEMEESVAKDRTRGSDDQQGQAPAETGATPDSSGRGIRSSRFSARVRAGVFVDGGDHDERSSGGDGCCDDCDDYDGCCDCEEAHHEAATAEADARQNSDPNAASAEPEADVAPAGASAENVGGDAGESDSDTGFVPMGVLPFSGDLFVPMTIPHDDRRDPPEDDEDPADDEDSEDK